MRTFTLFTSLLVACSPQAPSSRSSAQGASLPTDDLNIVVIMVDDLDQELLDTLLARGLMPELQTHVIDAGTTFTNSFVTNALCCPSRATYLTGQYSHNHHVMRNYAPFGSVTSLDHSSTLATWLKDTYYTSHIGKFLNGYGTAAGFTANDAPPPGWERWHALLDPSTYKVYNYDLYDASVPGNVVHYGNTDGEYQTDVLADRAVAVIGDAAPLDEPLFLTITPIAPHVELGSMIVTGLDEYSDAWRWTIRPAPRHENVPAIDDEPVPPLGKSSVYEDTSDKPAYVQTSRPPLDAGDLIWVAKQWRDRAKSMLAVDDLIGDVVDELAARGELDNTVIVFTSDNGFLHGEHHISEKLVPYEESIRVPLYIRAPGIPGGQRVEHIVLNNDLAPTIAELAGVTPGHVVDGRSLVPLLLDPGGAGWIPRTRFLVEHLYHDGIYDVPTYAAVRTPRFMYAEYVTGDRELYDLAIDALQNDSKHASPFYDDALASLAGSLAALRGCAQGNCQLLETQ
jgi:arylsulfatase A-like enzyme